MTQILYIFFRQCFINIKTGIRNVSLYKIFFLHIFFFLFSYSELTSEMIMTIMIRIMANVMIIMIIINLMTIILIN